ncbi:MAG: DUF3887 domain-containing protein [Eubacteriales bacterium]|nr:DUF3887 domain-containing protein [Eubacteriales bacterium]
MKKIVGILSAMLLSLLLVGCSQNKLAACFSKEELTTLSQDNITLAESGDYETFMEAVDPLTRTSFTEEIYQQYLDAVAPKGERKSFGNTAFVGQTDQTTGANYAAVIMIVEYEEGKIQYTLGYNEDLKLVQFLIK